MLLMFSMENMDIIYSLNIYLNNNYKKQIELFTNYNKYYLKIKNIF